MLLTTGWRAAWLALLPGLAAAGTIAYDSTAHYWTLRSSGVEYRLRQTGEGVSLDYFGPAGKPAWPKSGMESAPAYEISGLVEGEPVGPADLTLTGAKATGEELTLQFRHRRLPFEIEAVYRAPGDTGVITRRLTIGNRGSRVLHVESLPSLAWRLPAGEYRLNYLFGGWGQERQLAAAGIQTGRRVFGSSRGRSTNGYASWFALRNGALGVVYMAQLAWSGNWQMSFDRAPGDSRIEADQRELAVELGIRFDFGGALALQPGERFQLPEAAFTATAGDLDDAANQMHRYQRTVIPRRPGGDPPLVQFNSWYQFAGNVNIADLERSVDAAAQLGVEVFVLDSGWYNRTDWSRELGDYRANPAKFPHGLEELAQYVRRKGMKFGLWVEIENAGIDSELARTHPDWFLAYNGAPILKDQRHQLNFGKPEVREWARGTVDRLIRDYGLGWIKIDYNIDIGERFDPPGVERPGDVLYRHVSSYYGWLDEVRAAHPETVVENCSSGGLRLDLGILGHTHMTWVSDVVDPRESAQLGYGCTMEFAPEVCNHWMVGDDDQGHVDSAQPAGWWDFMFRVPMNGAFGISSRVMDWSAEMRQRAAANVELYKRLRGVIAGADVYHLTGQPSHNDAAGWMAIQYVAPDGRRSVLMAYRLGRSEGRQVFKLRGLAAGRYEVRAEGRAVGTFSAQELAGAGLPVTLDAEWRAAAIELEAKE